MWKTIKQDYIFRSPWLTVRKDQVKTEKDIVIDDFYVLEYPIWVNVIAITEDGKFVIEEQYRHGIQQDTYEICAGICESGEEPLDAAKRELLEETGYGEGNWQLIGKFAPNPNSMNNWCYAFLAEGVRLLNLSNQEPTENIRVHLKDKEEVLDMMIHGAFAEGIMLAPLWQYFYQSINKQ